MTQAKKLGGIRAMIASRMHASLQEAAQLTYFADADISNLLQLRESWKADGHQIGIEDCIVAVLARSLTQFPDFNALLDGEVFSPSAVIDISVAISSPGGLVTPVLRDVGQSGLLGLAEHRRDLVSRAMAGKLKVADMKGGTFTISNLGLTRVRHFTPILNRPQVALLGIGRIEDVAKPDDKGGIRWRKMMGLSLTADHRVLDGDPSGQFLADICKGLEDFTHRP